LTLDVEHGPFRIFETLASELLGMLAALIDQVPMAVMKRKLADPLYFHAGNNNTDNGLAAVLRFTNA
jgi:hypothetical protein